MHTRLYAHIYSRRVHLFSPVSSVDVEKNVLRENTPLSRARARALSLRAQALSLLLFLAPLHFVSFPRSLLICKELAHTRFSPLPPGSRDGSQAKHKFLNLNSNPQRYISQAKEKFPKGFNKLDCPSGKGYLRITPQPNKE